MTTSTEDVPENANAKFRIPYAHSLSSELCLTGFIHLILGLHLLSDPSALATETVGLGKGLVIIYLCQRNGISVQNSNSLSSYIS